MMHTWSVQTGCALDMHKTFKRGVNAKYVQIETMEHILTKCHATGQSEIWRLVEKLWERRNSRPITPDLGNILGSLAVMLKKVNGEPDVGTTHLYHLLIIAHQSGK